MSDRDDILKDLGLFAVISVEILGYSGAGVGAGYWLYLRGQPWWIMLLTSSAGLVIAVLQIFKRIKQTQPSPDDPPESQS